MYQNFAYLYDEFMKNVDYHEWTSKVEDIFRKYGKNPKTIADLACGTGGVTNILAAHGYQVIGVDISEDMLYVAREKARKSGLQVPYICQDISELSLHHPVDAILCMCDGFNYILEKEKLKRSLERIHQHLNSEGILIFDISSHYKLSSILGNNTMADTGEDLSLIWLNHFDKETQLLEMNLTIFEKQEACYERIEEIQLQRAWKNEEILNMLKECGFSNITTYSSKGLTPPGKRSHRIYFSCEV